MICPPSMKSRSKFAIAIAGAVCVATLVAVGVTVGLRKQQSSKGGNDDTTGCGKGRILSVPDASDSKLGFFTKAAVATDSEYCTNIAKDILAQDGSAAVDAAIAVLFCIGVAVCQSAGVGGGFIMTFYSAENRSAVVLNAREMAPGAANRDMYEENIDDATNGILAVAVPGEVKGSWEMHQRYGRLAWRDLIRPSIDLAKNGVIVTQHMANSINSKRKYIRADPSLSDFLNPETGELLQEGDILKRPKFAETLERIAELGGEEFYTGSMAKELIEDIEAANGILTLEDLRNYRVEWLEPISTSFNLFNRPNQNTEDMMEGDYKFYSPPPPASGVVLALVLNIFKGFTLEKESILQKSRLKRFWTEKNDDFLPAENDQTDDQEVLWFHRLIESFKFAYALRTELGDPAFIDIAQLVEDMASDALADKLRSQIFDNQTSQDPTYYGSDGFQTSIDEGTSHFSILAPNGDAIALTTTINSYFGAGTASGKTGIILNNQMGDFTFPNTSNMWGAPSSPSNYIEPGKRPLSSMAPTVISDSRTGQAKLMIGAAGGIRITTSVAYVIMRHLFFNETIKEAIDAWRIHHQLFPMQVSHQSGLNQTIIDGLQRKGHVVSEDESFGSVVNAISTFGFGEAGQGRGQSAIITANADFRKKGVVGGIDEISDPCNS